MRRSNKDWLNALNGGDPDQRLALIDLRDALIRNLRGALFRHGNFDDTLIQDVVQDSLLKILDRLEQFEGRCSFLTWATAIAIHVAMSELRRHRWKDVSLDELVNESNSFAEILVDHSPETNNPLDRKLILDKMYELIQTAITEKQRIALSLELHGVPQFKIAEHLGSSRNALYKLTHDARKALKRGLESAGYRSADILSVFDDRE